MITVFTGGDMHMLAKLVEIGQFDGADDEWKQKQLLVNAYAEKALDAYFANLGMDPFKEESK